MTSATRTPSSATADLASKLRPSLLRLTRLVRSQRADASVTLTHISALFTLEKNGPMSAGDLAACERVQPPSMTKILATLEERALVRREVHPSDRRSAIIAITEAGRVLLASERQRRDAWLTQRLARLTSEERAALRNVIPILDKLAEAE